MGDISREGDKQFASERYDRDAADPAALGANALAEPTAEITVRLISYPHPGKSTIVVRIPVIVIGHSGRR